MSRPTPAIYRTKKWPDCNEALKRRGSLTIWFDPDMVWKPLPNGKRGWQPSFSDAAIQIYLTMTALFGMPLRQTTGIMQSLLWLVGTDLSLPDFCSLCRRQRTQNASIPYRGDTGPLNLLIDSTGIKAVGEGEWNARKQGGSQTTYLAQDTYRH